MLCAWLERKQKFYCINTAYPMDLTDSAKSRKKRVSVFNLRALAEPVMVDTVDRLLRIVMSLLGCDIVTCLCHCFHHSFVGILVFYSHDCLRTLRIFSFPFSLYLKCLEMSSDDTGCTKKANAIQRISFIRT